MGYRSYAAVGADAPFYRGLTHHGYQDNGAMRLSGLDNYAVGKHKFLLLPPKLSKRYF
jgi:hypothetical protein